METGSRKRSSSAGSEKMERVGGRQEENERTLFDRPKSTVGCSANGRRRRNKALLTWRHTHNGIKSVRYLTKI